VTVLFIRRSPFVGVFVISVPSKGDVLYDGKHAVAQVVEALRYKSEGRGFDSRWCH
jgi:hypothetical protein